MDYNEYNSNGEKKKFSFDLKDKTSRSRFILFLYILLFIFLVIFIRINYKSNINKNINENNNQIQDNNEEIKVEENIINDDNDNKEENEIDSMFSFIDLNNYNFKYVISYNDVESVIEGKRYNNKFDFSLNSNNEEIYFNGVNNYLKVKTEKNGSYKITTFPYVLVNFFDNKKIKEIINNSILSDGVYKITNDKLSKILNENLDNPNTINEIELIKRNNKVVKINLDLTSAVSAYSKEKITAKLNLEYFEFGLVEDFKLF